jgi:hypothetical protein
VTREEPQISKPPMGAKIMPMMNRVGRTVFGVRIGCHAFSRCCLKAVSMNWCQMKDEERAGGDALAGRFQPPFSFLLSDPDDSEPLFCFLLKSPMMRGAKEGVRDLT